MDGLWDRNIHDIWTSTEIWNWVFVCKILELHPRVLWLCVCTGARLCEPGNAMRMEYNPLVCNIQSSSLSLLLSVSFPFSIRWNAAFIRAHVTCFSIPLDVKYPVFTHPFRALLPFIPSVFAGIPKLGFCIKHFCCFFQGIFKLGKFPFRSIVQGFFSAALVVVVECDLLRYAFPLFVEVCSVRMRRVNCFFPPLYLHTR